MSFLKYHKSDVDNYSTRDCEIYCLSKTRDNPLGIHKKSQCCQLTDTARERSVTVKRTKKKRRKREGRVRVECQSGQDEEEVQYRHHPAEDTYMHSLYGVCER